MSLWDDIRRTPAYESIPTAERAQAVTDAVDAVIANYVTPRGMVAAAAGRLGYHWIAGRTGRQWPIKPLVLLTWEHLGWLSASSLSRHQHMIPMGNKQPGYCRILIQIWTYGLFRISI